MMSSGIFRHRITVLKRDSINDPHGSITDWEEDQTLWGRFIEMDLDGRGKYQKMGFSEIAGKIQFPYKIDISLKENRFRHNSITYEPVEPPSEDGTGRLFSIVVKKIPQEEGGS